MTQGEWHGTGRWHAGVSIRSNSRARYWTPTARMHASARAHARVEHSLAKGSPARRGQQIKRASVSAMHRKTNEKLMQRRLSHLYGPGGAAVAGAPSPRPRPYLTVGSPKKVDEHAASCGMAATTASRCMLLTVITRNRHIGRVETYCRTEREQQRAQKRQCYAHGGHRARDAVRSHPALSTPPSASQKKKSRCN